MNDNQIILVGGNNILVSDEIKAEDRYIHCLTIKKSEVCKTEESKDLFNSSTKQIATWFKTLSFDTKVERSLLTNINSSVDEFKSYVTSKLESSKLKKDKVLLEKYNILFSKPECVEETKLLFLDNIYKLKFELRKLNNPNIPGFYSINTFFLYYFHHIHKDCKSSMFEAINSSELPDRIEPEHLEQLKEIFSEVLDKKLKAHAEEISLTLYSSEEYKLFTKQNKKLEGGDTDGETKN